MIFLGKNNKCTLFVFVLHLTVCGILLLGNVVITDIPVNPCYDIMELFLVLVNNNIKMIVEKLFKLLLGESFYFFWMIPTNLCNVHFVSVVQSFK